MDLRSRIKLPALPKRPALPRRSALPKHDWRRSVAAALENARAKAPERESGDVAERVRAVFDRGLQLGTHGRAKKLVGLKIGASQIAAAQVVNNGGPHLVQVAREELDPGIVVGGELRAAEELAAELKRFFRKHNLPRQNVRLGISNNRIGVRTFEISGIDEPKQLANAIKYRAQERLPIPVEEAVLDYQILSEYTDEEGVVHRRVLLVVAYRDLVDRYIAACKRAGIRLVGIDLEAFALVRALAPHGIPGATNAAVVVVSVGHDRTTFAVSDGQICQFTRVLEWGGRSLDEAIAKALDLTPSEARPIKLALSLAEPSIPAGLTSEQAAVAREAALREIHVFARELVSSLQFYQSQPGSLGIGEIILTGGTGQLQGLDAELSRLLGVRTRVGDPLLHVKVGRRVDRDHELASLSAAIGLGIEA